MNGRKMACLFFHAVSLAAVVVFCACARSEETATTVPQGTEIKIRLDDTIDVKTAVPGTEISAYVTKNIKIDKAVAIPKNTEIKGVIKDAIFQEGTTNLSMLKIDFNRIVLPASEEKELTAMIIEIGYSILPQSSGDIFSANAMPTAGAEEPARDILELPKDTGSSSTDSNSTFVMKDGTLVARGAMIHLKEGTKITLRLKKPLLIP